MHKTQVLLPKALARSFTLHHHYAGMIEQYV